MNLEKIKCEKTKKKMEQKPTYKLSMKNKWSEQNVSSLYKLKKKCQRNKKKCPLFEGMSKNKSLYLKWNEMKCYYRGDCVFDLV